MGLIDSDWKRAYEAGPNHDAWALIDLECAGVFDLGRVPTRAAGIADDTP